MSTEDLTKSKYTYFSAAHMVGSLPQGGAVPETPVHAVTGLDGMFDSGHVPAKTGYKDIDLGGLTAFYIENVALHHETEKLIEISEELGFRDEAPGIQTPPGMRQNKSVHWLGGEAVLEPIFDRIQPFLPQVLEGKPLLNRLSHRINMYRYDDQDVFNPHIDGDWPGYGLGSDGQMMVEWPQGRSMLTMLLYLNGIEDGILGGETHLYANGKIATSITPKRGGGTIFSTWTHPWFCDACRRTGIWSNKQIRCTD